MNTVAVSPQCGERQLSIDYRAVRLFFCVLIQPCVKSATNMATAVDLNMKCRLCSSGYNILNLYDSRHRNAKRLQIYIKLATGIVINENDKISTSICQNCAHAVDLCYQYRLNCQRNDLKFKALLAAQEKSGCKTVHSLDNQNTVNKVSGNQLSSALSNDISGKVQAIVQPKDSNISTGVNNPKTVVDQSDVHITKYDHLLLPKKRLKRRIIHSDDSSDAEDDPSYLPEIGQVPKKSERLKTKISRYNKNRTFIENSSDSDESNVINNDNILTEKVIKETIIEEQVQKVVEPLIEEPIDLEISYIDDNNDCNVNDDDIGDTEEQPIQISPSTSKIMIDYPLITIPKELYGINILPTIHLYRNNNIEDMIHKLTAITSSDNPSPLSKTMSSLITIPIRRKTRKYVKEGSDYKRMEVPLQDNAVNTKELLISSLELTAVGIPSSSSESVTKPNELTKNNLTVHNLNTPPIVDKSNLSNCTKTSSETVTESFFKAPHQYPQNVRADLNQSLLTLTDYEETSFVCDICNEIKNTHRKLVLHIRKNHMSCKYCHMKFPTVEETFNHIETNCVINICKRLPVLELTRLEDEIDIMAKYGSAFDALQSDTESTASSVFYTIKQTSSTKMTLVNNKAKKRTSGMKKKEEVKNIVKPKITSSKKSKKENVEIIELSDSDPEDNGNIRKHPTMTFEEYHATHNMFKGCMGKRQLEKQKAKPIMLSIETQTMLPSDGMFHLNSSSNSITLPMLKEDLKHFKISVAFKKDAKLTASYFRQKSRLKPREKSMNWSRMTPIGIKKPNKIVQPLPITTASVNLPVSTVQVTSVHKPNCTTTSGIVTIAQTSAITPTQHSTMSSSMSTSARTIPVNNSNHIYQTTSAPQVTQSSNALTLFNNPPNTQVLNQHLPNGVAFSSYAQACSKSYLSTVATSATNLPDPSLISNVMTLNYQYKDNPNQQHTVTIFDNNRNIALSSTAIAPVQCPYDSAQYPRLQSLVSPLRSVGINHPNAPPLPVLQPTSKPRLRIKEPWELR